MRTHARLHKSGRIIFFSAGIGMVLAAGAVSPAFATGSSTSPRPISKADANPHGANGQCPGGPYCSTRDGAPSLNGNGIGKAAGKPCAGCVGNADNKNPPGQRPDGSDHNNGYECDGNHGIGRTNPAHTGCTSTPPVVVLPKCTQPVVVPPNGTPPVVVPPVVVPPVVVPPVVVPPVVVPPKDTPLVVVPPRRAPVPVVLYPAQAAGNALPTASAAGQADTSGQVAVGGFAGLAAFLALGAGFVLRRRHGDA